MNKAIASTGMEEFISVFQDPFCEQNVHIEIKRVSLEETGRAECTINKVELDKLCREWLKHREQNQVLIEVEDGYTDIAKCPKWIEVTIKDYDNATSDRECPVCGTFLDWEDYCMECEKFYEEEEQR